MGERTKPEPPPYDRQTKPDILIIMGVSGSGKTTIGNLLADTLGWQFADADRFHPARNIEKMTSGQALDDGDRLPWLRALRALLMNWLSERKKGILACSSLKEAYREMLKVDAERVCFVYLHADYRVLQERLRRRRGHYMKEPMLKSQVETLEEPKDALWVDADARPPEIVGEIVSRLGLR